MALTEFEPLPEPALDSPGFDALGMSRPLAEALATAVSRRAGLVLIAGGADCGVGGTLSRIEADAERRSRSVFVVDSAETLAAPAWRDPDVVSIAAIDTPALADAAVQAALDGRLVIAGVAPANAVAAIVRMRALKVEPYRLAAALTAVIAQRQVRRLCHVCRMPVQARGSVSALLGFDHGTVVFQPAGCGACDGTGHAGETGVFEAVFPDAALRKLIAGGGDEAILSRHAFLNAPTLGSAARALVREGVIAPDEAVRISRGRDRADSDQTIFEV